MYPDLNTADEAAFRRMWVVNGGKGTGPVSQHTVTGVLLYSTEVYIELLLVSRVAAI